MKDDKQIFVEWLKYVIKIQCKMKGKELANKAGINPGTISGYITGKSKGPREIEDRIKICEILGADYQQVISAGRQKDTDMTPQLHSSIFINQSTVETAEEQPIVIDIDPVTTEHRELVKYFSSKKIALEVNRKMVELDNSDPIRFAELVAIISKFAKGTEFIEVSEDKQKTNSPKKTGTDQN